MPITFLDEEEDITPLAPPTKRKITFLDEEETEIAPTTPQVAQPAVTQPSQYKYDPARFRPKGLVAPKAEQEIGTLEGIANAARNAFDSSRQALDIVGDVTPEEAQNIAKIEFDKQSRKLAPGYDEYQKAEGFDAVLAFAKNPIEVTSNIVAEGLAGSLPALGAGLAAGGVGAAIGAPTGIGAPIGFTAGQVAGTFAGSLATEYGSKILEEMQEGGVDLTKPESIQGFFENEEAVAKARDKAISRGIPVAAFDAISAGIGGKLGRVIGKQFLTKTGEAAAELGVQAGLGGGGEVAGALVAGEPIEGKAVFGEIIGEAGPGAAEIITGRMADRAARVKAEEDAKIKAAAQLSDNLEQNSAPLTAAAVKSTTATTIEQDKLAAQLEEQLDADEIASQVSGQLAVTKEPTAAPPAIKSKEEFTAIYSQVAPEELDAAEAGFTNTLATAATEEARANAQNALEAIKEVKATVTPPAPTVEPTITPAVTPAVPTAQPPTPDATQEIIQPEGVRQEPQDRVEGETPAETIARNRIFGAARGQEEGQVAPTPQPIISEIPPTSELVGAEPTQPTIREVPEISPIVGAEPAAIVEQEPVAPAEPAVARPSIISEASRITNELKQRWEQTAPEDRRETFNWTSRAEVELENLIGNLAGNQNAAARQNLIEEITGTKPTRQNSAIKNVRQAIRGYLQANPLQETAAPTTEAAAQPAPKGVTQVAGVPPLVKELATAVRESAAQLRARISNVKMGPIEGNVETFTFDLDGQTYRGELKGRNRNLVLGANPTADAAIATRVLLDKNATPITPVTTPPVTEAVTPAAEAAPTPAGISVGNRVKSGRDPKVYVVEEVLPQTEAEQREGDYSVMLRDEKSGTIEKYPFSVRGLKSLGAKKPPLPKKLARSGATSYDFSPRNALAADQQISKEQIIANVQKVFEGVPAENIEVTNEPYPDGEYGYVAAYNPNTNKIEINQAYYTLDDDIDAKVSHELGHYLYQDPRWKKAFARLYKKLTPTSKKKLDAFLEQVYADYESGDFNEEAEIRAFDRFLKEAPDNRNLFQKFIDEILDFVTDALSVFSPYFKTLARDPRRIARNIALISSERFKAGEVIEGVDTTIEPEELRLARAVESRKEQVGGAEREETRYITTPKGILSMNTDVLREKFFDGTSVSPEKTTQAWGYISRLLDIKSGNANELAGEINDTIDADLLAKREAAIAAGEKVDPEEDVSKRIGAAMFSVELMNYAGRLAEQGDTRMLKFMIRNVNSMPTDKYAGDISDAARALRTRLEYDVSGFSAYTTEQKAKVDRTAAVMFGTNKPSKEQSDAVKDAIDESEKTELGNAGEVAGEVEKVEKRTKRKITDKIEKVIGKGSLKGMIQAVKDTPLEKQQERGWIEKVVNDFLINAGLSPEAASTASKLYESLIAERFAAAKQKAFEDNLKKAAPWKNYAARNSRLAKDALNKVQAAIRTGVLDPEKNTESIIAAESGWSGFTKDQYQRIVQLDSIINDPKQDDVTRREAMADLNKVISDAKLPVRFKDALGAYYVGNALMGIPTLTVNIASPIGFTVRNLMTDVSKFAFTDPARIPVAFETFMESMRSWYDQTSYAFKNQIYLNDVVEYLQGQNVLRELFDKGKKQWSEGKYAEGFVNMAVGMTQITGRVLSSLDQGAISMLENQNITRYALEALANTKGKVPKDKLKEFANMVIDTRRKTIAENIANGMSRDRAGVLADLAVKSEVISALAQYDVNPMNVLDSSINDALQSVGRNKTLTIKGIEQSQKNISDEGFMSYWPIKLLEMVSAGAGREGSSMQIFAKMLYGFALVPARVFHNVAWFSPYGFIRLGVDKYKKNKGEDSPYAMSLQTEAQYKQRLTDAIAGSVAMLGLAALSSASTDEDEDKKFKIVITGNGPSATTDKQYFDSWMKKWKPYSVHIVVNGNIIPINIGRGGEALFFPIMLAGALDDWKIKQKQNLTKKEPEDLSAIAQMLGSSFFALAQRGPYAAFTKPLFDASKDGRVTEELASQAGFFGKTFIPVLGSSLARNISDLFNDPVDRSSIEGAIYANTPVVGPWLGTKALNALGQPIRADDWGDKLFKLGVPVVFSFPKETPMNELNELILKQGSGPTIPTRANAQKRFGDILTDKEFETYVREYGRVMSDKMFKSRTKLANMKPADYDDELEKYARGYSIDGIKIKGASDSAVLAVKRMRQ
jgi:hypothetical protein